MGFKFGIVLREITSYGKCDVLLAMCDLKRRPKNCESCSRHEAPIHNAQGSSVKLTI